MSSLHALFRSQYSASLAGLDVSHGLTLKVGAFVQGTWTYADLDQVQTAQMFLEVVGWDLSVFDAWLFGESHWRSVPKIRQVLIELRNDLTIALRNAIGREQQTRLLLLDFSKAIARLTSRLKNRPEPLVAAMAEAQRKNLPAPASHLTPVTVARIRRMYQHMVDSGERYGARKQLVRQYKISEATLRKILKDC